MDMAAGQTSEGQLRPIEVGSIEAQTVHAQQERAMLPCPVMRFALSCPPSVVFLLWFCFRFLCCFTSTVVFNPQKLLARRRSLGSASRVRVQQSPPLSL